MYECLRSYVPTACYGLRWSKRIVFACSDPVDCVQLKHHTHPAAYMHVYQNTPQSFLIC